MTQVTKSFQNFISLLYPDLCPACGNTLLKNELFLCTPCLFEMPRLRNHEDKDNEVSRLFWGRVYIHNATAYFYYTKKSRYQKLIHKLKYQGYKNIGLEMGKMLGKELLQSPSYKDLDAVVPVPMHPKKEKIRGYNQSEVIAQGVCESMGIELYGKCLERVEMHDSQTKKNRTERWEGIKSDYRITDKYEIKGKHVLLVDDVITTGATIEACASQLLLRESKVSVAALGVTGI
ncbi:MAG: hypothetical protein A2W91_16205 [Bacteroidetes bacterium GWF2_38_335]|nr:MAG: hypothetical protein A2W91_16205 [Bacteroidetes bacterium GWF2_38_335]OFY81436.1 MAG: hypothetical protein A2281_07180 [Bacteroidetes bacterium RIFOXYA12_FULL_38_20]